MKETYLRTQPQNKYDDEAHIFCLSVETWPKWVIFLVGIVGVFGSFLLFGIAHEDLIERFKFTETFFLTFFQFVGYSAFSLPTFFQIIFHKYTLKAPLYVYVISGIGSACSRSLTDVGRGRVR